MPFGSLNRIGHWCIEGGEVRRWERARVAMKCGGPCGGIPIAVGDPMFVVTVLSRRFVRCRACAWDAVPDLPDYVPPVRPVDTPRSTRPPETQPPLADVEREPGCDD
jgi:hypothetical protein